MMADTDTANEVERVKAMLMSTADHWGICPRCDQYRSLWAERKPTGELGFAYCADCWREPLANTETANTAQPDTWEEWEKFCLDTLGREDPTLDSTHLYAIKAGARMIFAILREHFPSPATCQASGKMLEALRAADRVLDWASDGGRLDSVDGGVDKPCEMVIGQIQAAIAEAEPKP